MPTYAELMLASALRRNAEQRLNNAKLRRRIEMGYVPIGSVGPNGQITLRTPKGYIPYDTPTLKKLVLERMEMRAKHGLSRTCPINGRHQLQIRGKDLRRLKKAIPGLEQRGRELVIA